MKQEQSQWHGSNGHSEPKVETAVRKLWEERKELKESEKDERSIPLFWRMFGGNVMYIACGLFVVLYMQVQNGLNSIRSDVQVLREASHQLLPKAQFHQVSTRLTSLMQEATEANESVLKSRATTVAGLEARLQKSQQSLTTALDTMEEEIKRLRVRVAIMESRAQARSTSAQK